MLTIRSIARASSRLPHSRISASPFRSICSGSRYSAWRFPQRIAPRRQTSAFSLLAARREPAGQYDAELSAKLENERSLEEDSRDSEKPPAAVQDFLDNSGFEIEDVKGTEEVTLSKKFGDERIKVKFSIADMHADQEAESAESDAALEDEALYDDDASDPSGGARSSKAVNQARSGDGEGNVKSGRADMAASDQSEATGRDDMAAEEEASASPAYPCTLSVTIDKPGKGAMHIVTMAQDGMVTIENVHYYPKAEMAEPESAEADFSRANLHAGPPFHNLDPELQTMLERYLDERGINEQLASFVPDYMEFKEQREYVQWLKNVRGFVDA